VTHLRGITWDHPRGVDGLRAATAEYTGRTGVTIEWSLRSLQAFADVPLDQLVGDHDLLIIDHPHIPIAHEQGVLHALSGVGRDDELAVLATQSVGPSHRTYEAEGVQYALAIDVAGQVSVRRPDLLEVAPTTWDEVLALGAGGRMLWPAKPVDAISSFLTITANAGTPMGVDGAPFDREGAAAALDLMHRLASLVPAACLDENPIQTAERLVGSDEWVYAPLLYGYTNYGRERAGPRLAYGNIPSAGLGPVGACLGGAGVAVSARSAHAEVAIDFAFWVSGADAQRGSYFRGGGQPGHAAAWDDPALDATTMGFFSGTRRSMEESYVRPRTVDWLGVQAAAGDVLNGALRGEVSDRSCLDVLERLLTNQCGAWPGGGDGRWRS
jgi:multiple sugar transport system substrate-binding protein